MRFVELFAGIGGLGLGLEQAGLQMVTGYENWDKALDVWERNNKSQAFKLDLGHVSAAALHIMEAVPAMIVGGPPCQDYSEAGSGVLGENAAMTQAFAMIITIVRPEWFIFENTRRAPLSVNYRQARTIWKRAGYGLTELLVDASYYGVAQTRKRFFTIGRLGETDQFLESSLLAAASSTQTTVLSVLNPVKFSDDAELISRTGYFARPYTGGRGVHRLDKPAPTIIHTSTGKPSTKYKKNPHPDDHIRWNLAFQLNSSQAMRIQGFPDDFEMVGARRLQAGKTKYAKHDTMQMIANAVPPPLAKRIGEVILARAGGYSIPALHPEFESFLMTKFPPKPDPKADPSKPRKISPHISNVKSRVNRARKILRGQTYSNIAMELAALEDAVAFSHLDVRTKSDLRSALRLYSEFIATLPESRFARPRPGPKVERQPTLFTTRPQKIGPPRKVDLNLSRIPDDPLAEDDEARRPAPDPRYEPDALHTDSERAEDDNG